MRKHKIYIIKCYSKSESFIKLGFTRNTVKHRFKDLEYKYRVIRIFNTRNAELIERSIHRILKNERYRPKIKFVGYTECYKLDTLNEIHSLLNSFKKTKTKKQNLIKSNDFEYVNSNGDLDYVDLSMFKK